MSEKIRQTEHEFFKHLLEQLDFIKSSASLYDQGYVHEAKRLASTIRTLVHDTSSSISLLQQLNAKESLIFFDTAYEYNPKNLLSHLGLTDMYLSSTENSKYVPLCTLFKGQELPVKYKNFEEWWSKQIVIKDMQQVVFTRKDLILNLANKDGGSHVDLELDDFYTALSRQNSAGWEIITSSNNEQITQQIDNAVYASVRQIAFEIRKSILTQLRITSIKTPQ